MDTSTSPCYRLIIENYDEYLKAIAEGFPPGVALSVARSIATSRSSTSWSDGEGGALGQRRVIHFHSVKLANTEKTSICQWNGCGAIVDNSCAGLRYHLTRTHGVDIEKKSVKCYWGTCDGSESCRLHGGANLVRHIRKAHLELNALVCPICNYETSAFSFHVRTKHPEFAILG